MHKNLMLQEYDDLKKAAELLGASVEKFKPFNTGKIYTPEELEYYDSLSFRFEKTVELAFIFFKGLEIFVHARSSDTLRDRLLIMQKIKLVDDIDFWLEARLLRNKIAHTYVKEELKDLYGKVIVSSKIILKTVGKIKKYIEHVAPDKL